MRRRYKRHTYKKKQKRYRRKKLRGGFIGPVLDTVGTSVLNKIIDGIF